MKICNVVKNSVWYDPRVRKQIISYINENNVEVEVIGIEDLRYNQNKVNEVPCNVQIVRVDKSYFRKNRTIFTKIKRELITNYEIVKRIIKNNPDIIHANDLNALIPSFIASKIIGSKIIYDSHEVFVENADIASNKLVRTVYMLFEKYMVRHIDRIVCVSNAAAEYFKQKYSIEKPLVITNCSLKSEQVIDINKNEGFEVLNHGQFYEGRGYDIMVNSIPYLVDYSEIKLALRGFGKMEEALRQMAKQIGEQSIHFYPKVLVEELIPMAAKSHVGVAITEPICLNFKLSVSNKLFEYASAGLPVIMSDIPEHRYLNEKYQIGIILKDNTPETFAQAVIRLYEDKKFYIKCTENALKLSNELNWENEFKKLIDLEKSLLSLHK